METEISQPDKQAESSNRGADGRWVKGMSGNPLGRPKGKTMKEWARDYLSRMTDEERDAFMEGIPKEKIWAMAEGNPETKNDITTDGMPVQFVVAEVIAKKHTIENGDTHSETE